MQNNYVIIFLDNDAIGKSDETHVEAVKCLIDYDSDYTFLFADHINIEVEHQSFRNIRIAMNKQKEGSPKNPIDLLQYALSKNKAAYNIDNKIIHYIRYMIPVCEITTKDISELVLYPINKASDISGLSIFKYF